MQKRYSKTPSARDAQEASKKAQHPTPRTSTLALLRSFAHAYGFSPSAGSLVFN